MTASTKAEFKAELIEALKLFDGESCDSNMVNSFLNDFNPAYNGVEISKYLTKSGLTEVINIDGELLAELTN